MSDGLLAIGAFSRACQLSVKALRAYHEAGILVPARVDPRTGYRAYEPAQLTDATIIRRLRELDLPLSQVHEVVRERDPEVTRRALTAHAAVMADRLDAVTRIVAALQEGLDEPVVHTPIEVRDVPPATTLALRGMTSPGGFAAFLAHAMPTLGAVAGRVGAVPVGAPGALYAPQIPDDSGEEVEAYVPVAEPVALPDDPADRAGVRIGELPAARVAVVRHAGPYDSIDGTYLQLGRWIGAHAEPSGREVRESYLVSYGDTDDPDRFRTEILWPIRP